MNRVKLALLIIALVATPLLLMDAAGQEQRPPDPARLEQLMRDGNWNDAWQGYSRLALDPQQDPERVPDYLTRAINCLQRLGRIDEFDEFIEGVIDAHPNNWRVLARAAKWYLDMDSNGMIVAGQFSRGYQRRGTGTYANSFERDRIRSLQLYEAAIEIAEKQANENEIADIYWQTANALLAGRGFNEAWRLQYLSDLTELPDVDEGYAHWRGGSRGAPVHPDGTPVYHYLPEGWEAASTDGQRWRYALAQAMEYAPRRSQEIRYHFASFLQHQFGVQTMRQYGGYFGRGAGFEEGGGEETGTFALHTLAENETIARLAIGVRRFELPDEFNFIKLFQEIGQEPGGYQENSLNSLASIFENRRQYPKAADYWRRSLEVRRPTRDDSRQRSLEQIVGNWGSFDNVMTQPAGEGAQVDYIFRNGERLNLKAYEIDVNLLLNDVKEYLKSNPANLEWNKINISSIGYRLVTQGDDKYIAGRPTAEWSIDLDPRPQHFDRRITVATPLQRPGAYLLVGEMEDGNTSRIVLWVDDTIIVKKPMDQSDFIYVADAVTGRPVPRANVEFFGYRQEWTENRITGRGRHIVHTHNFAERTDANGQLIITERHTDRRRFNYVITATTPDGRLAYYGFTGVWYGQSRRSTFQRRSAFVITDRPVYRPEDTVNFKVWIGQATYEHEGRSPFAGQTFGVEIRDPRGEKIYDKTLTADEFGGINDEIELSSGAMLGVYRINIRNYGGGSFRVEEYKKPEFEVNVEAPDKPVMLGDKITARVEAKYYFGAPVTEAKVSYRIMRHTHTQRWYPPMPWDWFYGPGYWWFAYDYEWYPGWREWGCLRPVPFWFHSPAQQPEVVAEAEMEIGPDGILEIEIDTAIAKELHGDRDHRYEISVEVTDSSRRTIVGSGSVLVARKPFEVSVWVNRGHYRVGDPIKASMAARTLDGRPVQGKGDLRLYRITYDADAKPTETEVQRWEIDTDAQGRAIQQMTATRAGQYRISYTVTDEQERSIEGGYMFMIVGDRMDPGDFRFNDLELIPDKMEYAPGDTAQLMINTNRPESHVLLFLRAENGIYQRPKAIRLDGKSVMEAIEITKADMPNFFIEALTIGDGRIYSETREMYVPPEDRILDVKIEPSKTEYLPGEKATMEITVTGPDGEPFDGTLVAAVYDKSVDYISGGSNVQDIREFFWKWRRSHHPRTESSLKGERNVLKQNEIGMSSIGVFGHLVADEITDDMVSDGRSRGAGLPAAEGMVMMDAVAESAPAPMMALMAEEKEMQAAEPAMVEPEVREEFADTAFWAAAITTEDGKAVLEFDMPENLTTWKARTWAMGDGTRVGEASAEVVTTKNLIVRLQAPRFFMEKDEVVLSAIVHNYLETAKDARVELVLDGDTLEPMNDDLIRNINIPAGGEERVDWRVKVVRSGEASITMRALTDEESDAMRMTFPVLVHGILKTESWSGALRPEDDSQTISIMVPEERKPEQSRLEIRYSPTLAGAMVDALPYLVDYPYRTTESTLNRFLPTIMTQKILLEMGLDLREIQEKRTNLLAQEIGDDAERAKQWKRFDRNPVFDYDEVEQMVRAGVTRLAAMQNADGGWGWFSGWGERSYPHMTALVVHGLQVARDNDVALIPGMLERGVEWLKRYQDEQVTLLKNAADQNRHRRWKHRADNLDAFVYMVLVDGEVDNREMRDFLYRDRLELAVYAKAMFGLALHHVGDIEKRDMLIRNIDQFLVQDDENQTAYLRLPENNWWWYWYGSDTEANAYYLKLLAATDPQGVKASRLAKYLVVNRKNSTYWNSTRDTAIAVEALADFIRASGEHKPDVTVTILLNGEVVKEERITAENLFVYDNKFVLEGEAVPAGEHQIEVRRQGEGPLYFNAYLTNFTMEDFITEAGLEVKVERNYYRLERVEATAMVEGARGQAVQQQVLKYERHPIENLDTLKSGDLVEIELVIESKNDYEYIMFEDMKAAGFEPVEVQSGYTRSGMGAYMELRDEKVTFFVRALPRGRHSISYRMRAEIPGRFSALPTIAQGVYAPELRGNSNEITVNIED